MACARPRLGGGRKRGEPGRFASKEPSRCSSDFARQTGGKLSLGGGSQAAAGAAACRAPATVRGGESKRLASGRTTSAWLPRPAARGGGQPSGAGSAGVASSHAFRRSR